MGAEFLFMDNNIRPHRANNVDECLQSPVWIGQHTHRTRIQYSMCGICLADELQPVNPLPPVYRNFGGIA
ncbi:DDE_3 domain-containing protein [Trichonephila clavipes]|nr:DDE_3 domain-containing protein [Trichonephila clavipes]